MRMNTNTVINMKKNIGTTNQEFFGSGKRLFFCALFVVAFQAPLLAVAENGVSTKEVMEDGGGSGKYSPGTTLPRNPEQDPQFLGSQDISSPSKLQVSIPNGYANLTANDLRIRSTAGEVRWTRVWDGQEWKFNPQWESLSQSWKNLTGSQTADTTAGTVSAGTNTALGASGGSSGCWVWVDEDWAPSVGTTVIGGIPESAPLIPIRSTPFNRLMGEAGADYAPAQPVSVDYASLCAGSLSLGGASQRDAEGIRRINELYLGDAGRYAFNNRSVLEKRAVRQLPGAAAATQYASLATGSLALAPLSNPKGYRWIDKAGDWIDYNTQGQVVAWGDKNDNTVWLLRDTGGIVRGAVDANGRVLFSLHYNGELISEIRDYPAGSNDLPARSVKYQYDARNRLTQVTDARGYITRYDYDAGNHIVKITDPESRAEQVAYSGDVVKQRIAADGGVTDYTFDYDDVNKQFISKITGPQTAAGRRSEDYTHNRVGKLVRTIINGRTDEEIRYDTGARVDISTNARGFTTRTTKDEFEQVTEVVYADGAVTKRSYSAAHLQPTEEIDEAGIKTLYQYDSKGNLTRKVEAAGQPEERITDYEVNVLGQTTKVTRKGRTEANNTVTPDAVWQIEYDAQGQFSKTTDPEGHVRQYAYDRAGHLAVYTDPKGNTTRYEVDAEGNLSKVTDALGRVRSYQYDKVGNLIKSTDARGKAVQMAYDAMNRRTQTTNVLNGISRTQYNAQGLPVNELDEDGRGSQIEYDNFLQISKQVDALSNTSQFGYQISDGTLAGQLGSLGEPTQVNYPSFTQQTRFDQRERPTSQILKYRNSRGEENISSGTTYDQRGLILTETEPNGNIRKHRYDALGQRIETSDALNGKTSSIYDVRGNLIELTDALGNTYKFQYDRNDRVTKQIQPLGQITSYTYDAVGNLINKIDPLGNTTSYTLDEANRLTTLKQIKLGGVLLRNITQTWDSNDNLVGWSDTDSTRPAALQTTSATLLYDDANRKIGETITYPTPDGSSYTLSYSQTYSLAGKKTRLTWPDGTAIDYSYSAHGELESVSIPGEGSISVGQYKWTAPEKTTLPGGVTQNKSFDGLLNLETLKVKTPGQQTVLDLANHYGKAQELKSRERTDTTNSASISRSISYQYDAETRLTQAVTDSGGLFGTDTEVFTLDLLANRTAHSKTNGVWNYDANNRLIKRGSANCGQSAGICYDWDDAGNLIKKTEGAQVTQYGYDASNRLVQVKDGGGRLIAQYGYDPQDRRLWKEQYRDRAGQVLSSAQRTYYLYSDEGLIAESIQAITFNADNSVSANGAPVLTTQYGPRPESEFTTGVLFVKTMNSAGGNTVAYFHFDHLNIPIQATDKAGNVVWAAHYEAFGKASLITPAPSAEKPIITSNLRLPGQYEDQETGLHYNFRRYYDPEVGRYITEDPIGLDGGLNIFLYANADSINQIDPSGECPPCAVAAAIARVCVRLPHLCKAFLKCMRNPRECFCKNILRTGIGAKRNRPVHWVCDAYKKPKDGGPNGDTCLSATVKCAVGQACTAIRWLETNVCFGGKPHKPGDNNDIESQQKRANAECSRRRANICRKEKCG